MQTFLELHLSTVMTYPILSLPLTKLSDHSISILSPPSFHLFHPRKCNKIYRIFQNLLNKKLKYWAYKMIQPLSMLNIKLIVAFVFFAKMCTNVFICAHLCLHEYVSYCQIPYQIFPPVTNSNQSLRASRDRSV